MRTVVVTLAHAECRSGQPDVLGQRELLGKLHLAQGVVAQVTFRLQRVHQLFKRQIRMSLRPEGSVADRAQEIVETLRRDGLAAQHQGVDEQTDKTFDFRPRTTGHRHADPQVPLAGIAIKLGFV